MPPRKRFLPAPPATPRLTLFRALTALAGVVAVSTAGIMIIEGWSLLQSLFFIIITLTTVGYSDYALSDPGRAFSILVMLGGLATVTFCAGRILPHLFNYQLIWERKMSNRIERLDEHFIVCGIGRIGQAVCRHLAREGVPFIAIDPDPDEVTVVLEADHLALVGDATDDDVLRQAGIERARAIACVSSSDTVNIVTALTARELNADLRIVCRAEGDDAIRKMQRAGATTVISPTRAGSATVSNAILKPHLADFLERVADRMEDLELTEITAQAGSSLAGSKLGEQESKHDRITIIALKREDQPPRLRPPADHEISDGDVLIVAGDFMSIDAFRNAATARKAA
ncbi:MAG: hypothetical protein CMJ18_11410 [Phycisphaeraceae bacterium]|nr:hypothetical protein [Phycisphaeraceae bacterium]